MPTCIIYTRFSPRSNASECESCATQEDICREHAERQGWTVKAAYRDEAVSGAEEDRPGLWAAMEAARRGDILLVYRMDRLARNVYLGELLAKEATKKRIELRATEGSNVVGADETPEDRLIRQVLQAMAEYERRVIAARTKAAMLRHQKNGRRMGSVPPFGWKADPDDPKRLVPDVDEQVSIERMQRLREQGLSLNAICHALEAEGRRPRSATWTRQLVSRALKRGGSI